MLTALAAALTPMLPQEPATLHPQSAEIFLQMPDVQGLIKAYPATAMAKMIADPELHATFGLMMNGEGAGPVDPLDLLMSEYRGAVQSGDMPPLLDMASGVTSLSFSFDVEGDDIVKFIDASGEAGMESGVFAAENMAIRLVADFATEEAQNAAAMEFEKLFSDEAPRDHELNGLSVTLEGGGGAFGTDSVTVWSYSRVQEAEEGDWNFNQFEESMTLISGGKRMALAFGNVDSGEFVESLAANATEGSATALLASGRAAIGARAKNTTPVFEGYMQPIAEKMLLAEEPMALPLLDLAEGLFGPAASMVIRGGHWRVDIDDASGQFLTEGVHSKSPASPTAGLLGAQTLKDGALDLALANALVTTVTSLDKNVLMQVLEQAAAEEGEGAMDQLEEAFGFRPDRDLVAPLGSAVSYSLPALGSLITAPNLMVAVDLDDKDAFIRGMDGLFQMMAEEDDFELKREPYKKISTLYRIKIPGLFDGLPMDGLPIDLSSFFEPTIAVLDDRIIIGTTATHAKKQVRNEQKLIKSGDTRPVHAGLMQIGAENATTVSYADWATFTGGLYSKVKAFGPLMASMPLPFDPTMLPAADVMTRHFKPSSRSVRIIDGVVRHSANSSFGPEFAVLPLVGLAGVLSFSRMNENMMVEAQVVDAIAPPPGLVGEAVDSADLAVAATREALATVDVAITLFQLDNAGKSPAALSGLSAKSDKYPDGYLSGAVPTDGWDQPLIYEVTDAKVSLRSMGPNGVDDNGEGDDIVQK